MRDNDLTLCRSKNLRSNVTWRSTFLIKQLLFSDPASQAKINNNVIFTIILIHPDHDVFQFQIAMHYPLLSEMLQPICDIADSLEPLPFSLDHILCQHYRTFFSSSNSVPPSRYSITQISSFLEIYKLSIARIQGFLSALMILVSLVNVSLIF